MKRGEEQHSLGELKQQEEFIFKHGKFKIDDLGDPSGVSCKLIAGTYKKMNIGETISLTRKTQVWTKRKKK